MPCPFLRVVYFPSERAVGAPRSIELLPSLARNPDADSELDSSLRAYLVDRKPLDLSLIESFLATIDYWDLLAHRSGTQQALLSFSAIADAFFDVTGKRIAEPEFLPDRGVTVQVQLIPGVYHELGALSSGEKEVLAFAYFLRRYVPDGAVLLLDEPELHLHPGLQGLYMQLMSTGLGTGQSILATHSSKVISLTEPSSVFRIVSASEPATNQIRRVTDDGELGEVYAELGLTMSDIFGVDGLVVVEGKTDAQRLRMLFPTECARLRLIEADGAAQLDSIARTLSSIDGFPINWLCIRDRDFLSAEEVAKFNTKNVFVWERRELENHLIEPALIARTLIRLGQQEMAERVAADLKKAADRQLDDVITDTVLAELDQGRQPVRGAGPYLTHRLQDRADRIIALARSQRDEIEPTVLRLSEAVRGDWDREWPSRVDGKRLLGEYASVVGMRPAALINAIIQTCREEPQMLPAALQELAAHLVRLGGTNTNQAD